MIVLISIAGFAIGFIGGFYYCAFRVAKDHHWIRLEDDMVVVQKPSKDNILVAVPPQVARRIIAANGDENYGTTPEARNLYPERRITGMFKR